MDYRILIAATKAELTEQVMSFIKRGYKPQGGVSVAKWVTQRNSKAYDIHSEYAQAMWKEEE